MTYTLLKRLLGFRDVVSIIFSYLTFRDLIYLACVNRSLAHFIQAKFGFRWVPLEKPYTPYPHQLDTIEWMLRREKKFHHTGVCGGIVGLDMGLGKTLTSIMLCLIKYKKEQRPTLIITSKTILYEWINTFEKFFDRKINILVVDKTKKTNPVNLSGIHFVLTTYDTVKSIWGKYVKDIDHNMEKDTAGRIIQINIAKFPVTTISHSVSDNRKILMTTKWERLITDESQLFVNPTTMIYKSVMAVCANYRWCLTGTPVKNKETDMFSLMRFVGYEKIDKASHWSIDLFRQHSLSECIKFMTYEHAGIVLPALHIREHKINLSGNEKIFYDTFENRTKHIYEQMMLGNVNFANVLALFTRLRQISIASHLITLKDDSVKKVKGDRDNGFSNVSLADWVRNENSSAGIDSAKINEAVKIVNSLPKDKKVIIFSTFSSALTLVEKALMKSQSATEGNGYLDYKIARIDGSVLGEDRDTELNLFKGKKDYKVLLMTYKTGSEGLNLTVANHVICLEPWWTPSVEKQAIARVWRNGQTQPVYCYRLIITNSIESNMIRLICDEKEKLANNYLNEVSEKLSAKATGINKELMGKILFGR